MTSTTTFATPAIVKAALDLRVRAHFGTRRTTDSVAMYVKAAVLVLASAGAYTVVVFRDNAWPVTAVALVVLALALAGIGFNVQHDGNHGGFSRRRWVNRSAGFTLDLIGASSYFWKDKHNHNHHVYTNIPHEDADINLGPMGTVLAGYALVSMAMGLVFSVVFQLAHTVDIVEHPSSGAALTPPDGWCTSQPARRTSITPAPDALPTGPAAGLAGWRGRPRRSVHATAPRRSRPSGPPDPRPPGTTRRRPGASSCRGR